MRLCTFLMGVVLLGLGCRPASLPAQGNTYDSGGPLLPEQAAYDVTFYDLQTVAGNWESDGFLGKRQQIKQIGFYPLSN